MAKHAQWAYRDALSIYKTPKAGCAIFTDPIFEFHSHLMTLTNEPWDNIKSTLSLD